MQISDSRTCQSNASIFSDSLILLVASQNGRLTTRNTTNHFQQIKDLGLKCIGNVQYLKKMCHYWLAGMEEPIEGIIWPSYQ